MKANSFLRWSLIILITLLLGIGTTSMISIANTIVNILGFLLVVFWLWLMIKSKWCTKNPFKTDKDV